MDPLSLLRDFNLKGKLSEVKREGDRVNFGGAYVFPLTAYTAFKNTAKDYYTLEVILNLLLNRHLSHPEYIKQANANKVGAVAFTDRKKLLEFLDGKGDLQLEAPEALLGSAVPGASELPAAKRARLHEEEGEISAVGALAKQERQLRTRNTMLIAPNKDFKKVIEIVQKAMHAMKHPAAPAKDAQKPHQPQPQRQPQPPGKHAPRPDQGRAPILPVKPSGRFDREAVTEGLKAMGGEAGSRLGNVISMYGAYKSNPVPGSAPPKPAPKPVAPAPVSGSRHGSGKPGAGPALKPGAVKASGTDKPRGGIPIIIVPSGMSAMINMFNAKQFLETGRFEPSAVAQQRAGNVKQSLLLVTRTAGKPPGHPGVPYHVIDKAPDRNATAEWERVVAVITQGAKWQFKDWPFKGAAEGDLSETFQKVCGFYLHYSDEKVPESVANWAVKRYGLHRDNRHLDTNIMMDMYRQLDTFLLARRAAVDF